MKGLTREPATRQMSSLASMQEGNFAALNRASRRWSKSSISAVALLTLFFLVFLIDQILQPGYFTIERIHIEGLQYRVDSKTIERTAWRSVNGNYFSVDLKLIEAQLKEVPGVYDVAVRRVWPGTLQISITESEGLAKWSALPIDASPSLDQLVNLPPGRLLNRIPELSGPAARRQAVFNAYLEADHRLWPLGLEILTVKLTWEGDWTFGVRSSQFDSDPGFLLIVGRHDPAAKVNDFAQVFEVALRNQWDAIAAIDLRYPSGLAVQWNSSEFTISHQTDL